MECCGSGVQHHCATRGMDRNRLGTLEMEYTLAGAAEATGVAKTTIFRAIKSGKLSARRLDDKTFRIDGAELSRVYAIKALERSGEERRNVPQQEIEAKKPSPARASETELAVLKLKLEHAEADLGRERQERERERDDWERERSTIKLIEHQLGRERDDLLKRLEEERAERREAQQKLMERATERSQDAPNAVEPDRSQEVETLQKRLEDAEARIAALGASQKPQDGPSGVAGAETPARVRTGFLGRFLGRQKGALP